MYDQLSRLGARIKAIRKQENRTLQELAAATGLTAGLLSKIENFRTVPSLPVLLSIAEALGVEPGRLFDELSASPRRQWLLIRPGDQRTVEREESSGFEYRLILETAREFSNLQVMLVTIHPGAKREAVAGEGDEMLYVVSGALRYRVGEEEVELAAGDTLFFNGTVPHLPLNPYREPAVLLVHYFLRSATN